MLLRDYLRILRRGWPVIVALAIIGVVVGGAATVLQRPQYSATAKAYVFVSSATNLGDLAQSTTYTQQIAASFADIATTSYVLAPVIAELKLDETPVQLSETVTVTAVTNESVLQITAVDSTADGAARIANAVGARLTQTVRTLTPETARVVPIKATLVNPAVPPASPTRPVPSLYIGIGLLAGLLIGIVLAVLRVVLDTRVRSARDLALLSDRPVLGSTPADGQTRRRPVALVDGMSGPRAESYRSLRTSLQFLRVDDGAKSFVITSSIAGEGKSVTAANLAVALAEAGERVVLVDGDLRRPTASAYLGLEGAIGLTDVLVGRVGLDEALQDGARGGLAVLPAGMVPPNPNELLQSRSMQELLADLESRFDRLVIDSPPVLPVSDAAILANRTAGALVVVAAGRVKRSQVEAALAQLEQTGAPVLGLVLNMVPTRGADAPVGGASGYPSYVGPADRPSAGEPRRHESEATA